MKTHRLYYALKPYVPWKLRMVARRISARRTREDARAVWPIQESAARPPAGWPGWPDGKQFAVVLTHDVEGPEGLEKCRALAELEMKYGFRSSFNLVPEGTYTVPDSLRTWLGSNGFEVGVHDLHHDGKLFTSERVFKAKAERINHYLREWNAKGFRAAFMMRNLDWYRELDIQYDASTFDTDPFEWQSDGTGTIFPFWVPAADGVPDDPAESDEVPLSGGGSAVLTARAPRVARPKGAAGYVELPYTLPQDSTLFLVLREKSPDIWLRKADWLARHGGMVLVNVHPDYLGFDRDRRRESEFPVEHYEQFLNHLRHQYAGKFWNPLPHQMASWYMTSHRPHLAASPAAEQAPARASLRGKRAAVLLYSDYPSDPRPRRAAEAMIEAGMEVDVLALAEKEGDLRDEVVNGVRVFRVPLKRSRANRSAYLWKYASFFIACFWFLFRRSWRRRYDVVHVHNMPDFLVFAAAVPRLRGAKVMLDLHDPMPELMMTIYGLDAAKLPVRVLRLLERLSLGFADLAFTPNIAFKNLFAQRSCPADKIHIVMNSPQESVFHPDRLPATEERAPDGREFRIMHHGLIAHRHGVDLLVEAVARLRTKIPGLHLDIYGNATPFLATVQETAARLGVSDIVHHHGTKTQPEIAVAIRRCDLGVVPNRRSVFTEINFPTRLFEYLAMHRPVLAPNTQGIRDYFGTEGMLMFEPESVDDLAAKILFAYEHPELMREYVSYGVGVYRKHLWREQKEQFIGAVSHLLKP